MTRVRSRFPHTLELRFEPAGGPPTGSYTRRVADQDDLSLCCGFLEHVRRRPPSDVEHKLLAAAVEGARVSLARESGVAPLRAGRRLAPAAALVTAGGNRPDAPRETDGEERVAG